MCSVRLQAASVPASSSIAIAVADFSDASSGRADDSTTLSPRTTPDTPRRRWPGSQLAVSIFCWEESLRLAVLEISVFLNGDEQTPCAVSAHESTAPSCVAPLASNDDPGSMPRSETLPKPPLRSAPTPSAYIPAGHAFPVVRLSHVPRLLTWVTS